MEELKIKPIPLDEQIKFIHDARHILIAEPKAQIRLDADHVDHLAAIELNLIALKISNVTALPMEELPACDLPVDTEVYVEIPGSSKSEWINGHIKHYDDGKPVVMTYYGILHKVENPAQIMKANDE